MMTTRLHLRLVRDAFGEEDALRRRERANELAQVVALTHRLVAAKQAAMHVLSAAPTATSPEERDLYVGLCETVCHVDRLQKAMHRLIDVSKQLDAVGA